MTTYQETVRDEISPQPDMLISPRVLGEVAMLQDNNIDVKLVRSTDMQPTDLVLRERVGEAVTELSKREDGMEHLFRPEVHPMGAAWWALSKRAVALWPLHAAKEVEHIGESIDPGVYHTPLFTGKSAAQILEEKEGLERADKILGRYQRFIDPSNAIGEAPDEYGLASWDYLRHVVDSYAVRSRAAAALASIERHFFEQQGFMGDRLVSASLACGAAAPVFDFANSLKKRGVELDMHLVDWDAMALATATSLATRYEVADQVHIERRDLMRTALTTYIEPHSVDVVDMLGIFEYIPKKMHAAADLLASVKDIVKPGGLIVFGNMLKDRPQQEFFSKVWPKLQQRSIAEVLSIIKSAGYDLADVAVDIPEDEGVYAVYTIRIPEGKKEVYKRSPLQKLAHTTVLLGLKDY